MKTLRLLATFYRYFFLSAFLLTLSSAYRHPSLLTFLPQFPFIPRQLRLKRIFSDFGLSYRAFADAFPEMKDHEIEPMARLSGGQQRLVETCGQKS